ncbi:MAG: hypothetical protein JRC86_10855 [Deltaproteobacteria bacterium]|nr:hypothetical protein [Deltaproteobacteria bacterium]
MATAAVVTVSEHTIGSVKKIEWTWLSSDLGAAELVTTKPYNGELVYAVYTPGGTTPTADWDVVINDDDGNDVLAGDGIDKSESANSYQPSALTLGAVAESKLTMVLSNAGDAKTGKVAIYLR